MTEAGGWESARFPKSVFKVGGRITKNKRVREQAADWLVNNLETQMIFFFFFGTLRFPVIEEAVRWLQLLNSAVGVCSIKKTLPVECERRTAGIMMNEEK